MKALKVIAVVVLPLVTMACSNSPLNHKKADYLCRNDGGVYSINNLIGVTCNTGKVYGWGQIQDLILPVEFITQNGGEAND